jgi:uncharacterized membrane protein YfcA
MLTMTAATVVTTGAFAGGFVSGLAGFGTGLVALGFWLYVLEPAPAATLVAVCSVIAQVQTLRTIWHEINASRIWPIVVAGLIGVPVGTILLSRLDPAIFRLGVGMFLIAFSVFMMMGRIRPRVTWGGRMADSAIGFAGGVLGGLAGLSGPLPTAWATLRGWNKSETRAVLQVFSLVVLAAVVAWHFAWGLLTPELGLLVLVAIPGTMIGAWLGARLYRRLSDRRFNEVLLCLLGLSGLALVWVSQ